MATDLETLIATLKSLGPQRVKTKEFEADQFDPIKIQQLIERQSRSYPTFANFPRTVVQSNRAVLDVQTTRLTIVERDNRADAAGDQIT